MSDPKNAREDGGAAGGYRQGQTINGKKFQKVTDVSRDGIVARVVSFLHRQRKTPMNICARLTILSRSLAMVAVRPNRRD